MTLFFSNGIFLLRLPHYQSRQMMAHLKPLCDDIWRKISRSLKKNMYDNIAEINRNLSVFLYCHVFGSDFEVI